MKSSKNLSLVEIFETESRLDYQQRFARVSEGFCQFCNEPLEPHVFHEEPWAGCRCCGFRMRLYTPDGDDEPCLSTTGWPGEVDLARIARCRHFEKYARGEEVITGP